MPQIYSVVHDRLMRQSDVDLAKLGGQTMDEAPSNYEEAQVRDAEMKDINKPSSLAAAIMKTPPNHPKETAQKGLHAKEVREHQKQRTPPNHPRYSKQTKS
jgi:hypothetical protein